jgi:DNA-binding transcriptional MerR regulator
VTDQRIQAVPDARTLRFYQSTGLLDRPLRYDGRVAKYGWRHLLQVVAVRALQAQGMSLAQVQAALAGATQDELEHMLESTATVEVVAAPVSPRPAPVVALIAVELAPGVIVTVDSRMHPDPQRTIQRLRRAIRGTES